MKESVELELNFWHIKKYTFFKTYCEGAFHANIENGKLEFAHQQNLELKG